MTALEQMFSIASPDSLKNVRPRECPPPLPLQPHHISVKNVSGPGMVVIVERSLVAWLVDVLVSVGSKM